MLFINLFLTEGGDQYLQRRYIVLCTSENKTIFINIIIIVIIIVMKSGAPLLGLAKSIYYMYCLRSMSWFTFFVCVCVCDSLLHFSIARQKKKKLTIDFF